MRTLVFDSWALIAWITNTEPARTTVRSLLDHGVAGNAKLLISAINIGEVYYVLAKRHSFGLAQTFRQQAPSLPMTVVVPSMIDVWRAADEKRSYAISYADAFAAALAKEHDAELVTGDAEFRSISALKLLWLEAH